MSLIGSDYFKQDINIPSTNVNSDIANVITRYEPEILKKVLGYELWDLIKDSPTSPDRLNDLINGVEYTVSYNNRDQIIKWNGLKNTEKISLIAYYVYFMWQTNHASNTTNVGESASVTELSDRVSPAQKMGSAYSKMRQLVGYAGQDVLEPSLYNFLKENETDYPEWVFKDVGSVNMFGI
jgi:hypothetical protein